MIIVNFYFWRNVVWDDGVTKQSNHDVFQTKDIVWCFCRISASHDSTDILILALLLQTKQRNNNCLLIGIKQFIIQIKFKNLLCGYLLEIRHLSYIIVEWVLLFIISYCFVSYHINFIIFKICLPVYSKKHQLNTRFLIHTLYACFKKFRRNLKF